MLSRQNPIRLPFESCRAKYLCFTALLLFAVLGVGATAQSSAPALDSFPYNGIVNVSYQANEYAETPQGPQSAAAIRATGANYAAVVATQYQQTATANTIAPETASSSGYNPQLDPLSPTDAAVIAAISNLHAQGLTVVMKPQVDSLDRVFRGQFAPTDPAAWFASYTTFLLHYAQIASQNGIGILIIGTELKNLSGAAYAGNWNSLIAQLRTSYPNLQLVYGANATGAGDEFSTVSFWSKVDVIGVDGYFPLTGQADPTVAQLVAAWSNNKNGFNALAALKQLQAQYNKPLIFTELGYVSAAGTNEAPYSSANAGAAYDPVEQANCYEAFFEVFSSQSTWMKGVFWWAWNVSPPSSTDTGYTPQNKAAATTILPKWYGSTTPAFSLALANPLLSLGQLQSVTTLVSTTALGGFSGTPNLTAAGLPAGVSATFTAGSVAGTQVMTLTSRTAVPGTSTVTVNGTSGSMTGFSTLNLTITGQAAQTITFAQLPTQTAGTSLVLSASASSGLPIAYNSTTPAVCTVSGQTATFVAAGTCTLAADQAGSTSYNAAPEVQQSFTVTAPSSFSLTAMPSSVSLTPGGSGATTITIVPAGGFSGSVSLSLSGLPAGISGSLSTSTTSVASTLTLTATTAAPTGTYSATVTGTSGSLTGSTVISITVQPAPALTLSPQNPSLSTTAGAGASDVVTLAGNSSFSGTVTLSAVVTTSPNGAQYPPNIAITPATLTLPANGSATATLSVVTTAASAKATKFASLRPYRSGLLGVAFAFLLPFGLRRRRSTSIANLSLAAVFLVSLTGCSSGSSGTSTTHTAGTTAGSYTITVTATGGTVTTTLPITLTVR